RGCERFAVDKPVINRIGHVDQPLADHETIDRISVYQGEGDEKIRIEGTVLNEGGVPARNLSRGEIQSTGSGPCHEPLLRIKDLNGDVLARLLHQKREEGRL